MTSYTVFLVHGKILGIEVFGKRPEGWYLKVGIYLKGRKFRVHINPLGRGKDIIVNSADLDGALANLNPELATQVKELLGVNKPTLGDILGVFPGVTIKHDCNFTRRS